MTVLERLLEFAKSQDMSTHAFEKRLGKAHSYFNQVKSVSSDVVQRACDVFPELSAEWLIRGKGPMLLTDDAGACTCTHDSALPEAEEVKRLNHKVSFLLEQVTMYQDRNMNLEIELRMLKEKK